MVDALADNLHKAMRNKTHFIISGTLVFIYLVSIIL